ncbi:hypothetical protein M422DRAFT_22870 [Sphaerobolus stellatus SS14]|nr:hypothetical protein M422DRAFT_22870 [Sphaerobolus stellatus SS14]
MSSPNRPFSEPAHSLPTPPYSPDHTHVLDALIAQYQRERMWVKHTQDLIAIARHQYIHGDPAAAPAKPERIPLWKRRKGRQGLRLSSLSQTPLSPRLCMDGAYGPKVLDLFAELLEARIESCKRVEALIADKSVHQNSCFMEQEEYYAPIDAS